jgi:hypothetical protein
MNTSTVLVRALLAYSVHEHHDGAAKNIRLELHPRAFTIQDDGRGMGLDRDGYVPGLLEQLAARHANVALHGIGLAIIAMSSPLVAIESRRGGRVSTQPMRGASRRARCTARRRIRMPRPARALPSRCPAPRRRSKPTPCSSRSSSGAPRTRGCASRSPWFLEPSGHNRAMPIGTRP